MRRWEFYVDQVHSTNLFFRAMIGMAGLLMVAEFVVPIRVPAAALFALYAMWCFNARQWMQRFADMQARIDMMLIAQGKDPE